MKFKDRIKSTLSSMKNSIKRFPITILISISFVILQVYIHEQGYQVDRDVMENYNRLRMIIGLGIPLSLCIGLINEVFFKGDRLKKAVSYIVGLILLLVYYLFLIKEINTISMIRYISSMLFLVLSFFYIPRLKKNDNYELHVMSVNSSAAVTFIYSAVLYFGLAAILFTIDKLFDANIDGKYYYYMFLIVAFIFGIALFLSKLPNVNQDFREYNYSSSLKILLVYIVIPLITAYTIILYIYFAKIIFTWVWPRGLVSHLVLWYSTLSVFIIFSITPILEENKTAKTFKIWFPKVVLPILLMMFMSMFQRVEQYGITENRYFIIALGLWVTGIMIYFSLVKPLKNIIIPITLSLVVLNSVYGPLSSFNIAKGSQNKRLTKLLIANHLLVDGNLVKNENITSEGKKEISNIIQYFVSDDSINDTKVFPDEFKISQMEEVLGFPFKPDIYGNNDIDEYFYYHLTSNEMVVNIEGFDYYTNISGWNSQAFKIDNMDLTYNENSSNLTLVEGDNILFSEDINEIVSTIHNKLKGNSGTSKNSTKLEDMVVEKDYNDVRIKIIFTNISGIHPLENDKIILKSTEFILMIDKK